MRFGIDFVSVCIENRIIRQTYLRGHFSQDVVQEKIGGEVAESSASQSGAQNDVEKHGVWKRRNYSESLFFKIPQLLLGLL